MTWILPDYILREVQYPGSHLTALYDPSEVVCGIFV